MKGYHVGAFNRNVGDNIALLNARRSFEKRELFPEWEILDLGRFWIEHSSKQFFADCKEGGFILIGGGGLLEWAGYRETDTGIKLPTLPTHSPSFVFGIGINAFRGDESWPDSAIDSMQKLIDTATVFSFRVDGSLEKAKEMGIDTSKTLLVPDPGLLHLPEKSRKEQLTVGGFQPAYNNKEYLNNARYLSSNNLEWLEKLVQEKQWIVFPHTPKDFKKALENYVISEKRMKDEFVSFENVLKFVEYYDRVDYMVCLRGHGQYLSIATNTPSIYLSTQDKVRDFSLLNGFADYNVSISAPDWKEQLEEKVHLLETDSHFVEEWYNIRTKKMVEWYKMNTEFITACLAHV